MNNKVGFLFFTTGFDVPPPPTHIQKFLFHAAPGHCSQQFTVNEFVTKWWQLLKYANGDSKWWEKGENKMQMKRWLCTDAPLPPSQNMGGLEHCQTEEFILPFKCCWF